MTIVSISIAGVKFQRLVIFKGQNLQTTWFPVENIPDWLYTTSENKWTSTSIGLEWLKRIFIPISTPRQGQQRLLILDSHRSHIPVEFTWTWRKHNMCLLYLPPHFQHILQLLDLARFLVVKSKYRKEIRHLSAFDDATFVKKGALYKSLSQSKGGRNAKMSNSGRLESQCRLPL